MHGGGHPEEVRGVQDRQLRVGEAGGRGQEAADALPHPPPFLLPEHEGLVEGAPRLLGHAEGPVAQAGGDVFGGRAEARHLVVVDGGRAVHPEVGDDAAAHEVDEDRGEPGLHHVAAEHDDDAPPRTRGRGDGGDDAAEVARHQDVGERVDEGAERAVGTGRARELARAHPVGAPRHGDGPDARQVGLGCGRSRPGGAA
ncbi:MAG: hypothetical protein AMXMBFR55_22380 [Gemmatimonadota bacterium]